MHGTIRKWGNSLAVRLPGHIAQSARLHDGATVEIAVEDDALVIRSARKRFKLEELLADYQRPQAQPSEVDWGKSEGDEVW